MPGKNLGGAASLSDEADPDVTGGIYPFWDDPGAAASDDGGDGAIYASGLAGADQHQQSGKAMGLETAISVCAQTLAREAISRTAICIMVRLSGSTA